MGRQRQQQQRRYRDTEPVFVQRSALLSKPIITRTSGTNLGVVNQLWVDTNNWKVVALDVRPNMFFGEMDSVLLDKLKQIGDVILVHDESDAQSHIVLYGLNYLVGSEVVTEVGGYLGKVRDYTFNPEDGQVTQIHFDALGAPAVPSSVLSTYSVSCGEIVSVGPDRVVVASGAESRVQQLSSGVMQRLALYEPPWEAAYRDQYEMDYYSNGYALPPYQEQYNQNRMMPPPQQQQEQNYMNRQQMNVNSRGASGPPPSYQNTAYPTRPLQQQQQQRQPMQQQKRYDDFIEVQEEQPEMVYEAQIQQKSQQSPGPSASGGYSKDEDRL
jgi:sporulation protein YlmC with PRC-barrel domain